MDVQLNQEKSPAPYQPSRMQMMVRIIIDIYIMMASFTVIMIAFRIHPNEFSIGLVEVFYLILLISVKILAVKSGHFRIYINSSFYTLIIMFMLYTIRLEFILNQSPVMNYYIYIAGTLCIILCLVKISIFYALRKKEV